MKKEKDKIFFEELFSAYSDVTYRFALYKTGSVDVAEDITQETFLRVWSVIQKGKNLEKPKSYIYQITRNLITEYYRSNKTHSLDSLREEGFDWDDKKYDIEILSDLTLLKEVINQLDEIYRMPIYLKYIEGYRVQEIAETLNITENVTSVRINRAIKKLQEYFS